MKSFEVPLVVVSSPETNITDLFLDRVKLDPNLALISKQVEPGVWQDVTASDYLKEVKALAKGFIASGIKPGQRVGIMSPTSYEWALCDFALWFAGAVSVPIYESSAPAQIEWILGDSGAIACIFANDQMVQLFNSVKSSLKDVKKVWTLDLSLIHI